MLSIIELKKVDGGKMYLCTVDNLPFVVMQGTADMNSFIQIYLVKHNLSKHVSIFLCK